MASKRYRAPRTEFFPLTPMVYDYLLKARGLSKETVDSFCLSLNKYGELIIPFYDEEDTLCLVKRRSASGGLLSRRRDVDGITEEYQCKTDCESGGKPVLLGSHLCDVKFGKTLIIAFGDYDAMSIYEAGVRNVVSPPYGDASHDFVDIQWDFLNKFDEIILFPDYDVRHDVREITLKKIDELAVRLGKHKCRMVDVEILAGICKKNNLSKIDPNDIHTKIDNKMNLSLLQCAPFIPEPGLARLSSYKDEPIKDGIPTGFKDIDAATGGIHPCNFIVISGDNHSGKTTLVLNLCANLCQENTPVFFWSGEQNPSRIRWWFEQILSGPKYIKSKMSDRTGREYHFIDPSHHSKVRHWYNDLMFVYDKRGVDAEQFFKTAEIAVRRHGCKVIIVDNLMAFTGGEEEYYKAQGQFAESCKNFGDIWNVTVILLAHNRKFSEVRFATKDDVEGSKKITSWADLVFQCNRLSTLQKLELKEVDMVLGLVKNRDTGELLEVRVVFDSKTKRMTQLSHSEMLDIEYSWTDLIAQEYSDEMDYGI